jgi:uncharacterized membrane protein YkvA (DUF1232 family)
MKGLVSVAVRFRDELGYYRTLSRHPETPALAKVLLGGAVGYALLPFDLIPDFLPVIGQLDDLVVVPLLVIAANRLIPKRVREECRGVGTPARQLA